MSPPGWSLAGGPPMNPSRPGWGAVAARVALECLLGTAVLGSILTATYRAELTVPAMLSGTGQGEEVVRDLAVTVRPNGNSLVIAECTGRIGTAAVSLHGSLPLPRLGTGGRAGSLASFMRERFALGFVDIGGWDTHIGQGAAEGFLASRFEELGRGLAGFADEMGAAAWQRTVVAVVSEFGRTFRENGGRGTDHGHGSVCWLLGGALKCPPIVGEQQVLTAATLNQNRDLPVLNPLPEVLGGLFTRQFGLQAAAVSHIFPGVSPRDLQLV